MIEAASVGGTAAEVNLGTGTLAITRGRHAYE